jgi:hypothetical protein
MSYANGAVPNLNQSGIKTNDLNSSQTYDILEWEYQQ